MSNLGVPSFTLTLDSNDPSVYPADASRHVEFRTEVQPLEVIQENEAWVVALSSIEFTYTATALPLEGVNINVSIIDGTRIGSVRTNLLYRIPGAEFTGVAAGTRIVFVPKEPVPLWQSVEADVRYRRNIEAALTDDVGNVLPTPGIDAPTVITLSFQRVA